MDKEQNKTQSPEPEIVINEVNENIVVERKGSRDFLAISILVAAVIISGTLFYLFGSKNAANLSTGANTTVSALPDFATSIPYTQTRVGDRVVLGDPNAPVTITEYSDYQCTYCGKFFNETEPLIFQNYVATGKVKFISKNLIVIGNESVNSAMAASCAMDQNKFWEYRDALFTVESKDGEENSGNLTKDLFMRIADKLGMDKNQFASCYDSKKYSALIASDVSDAQAQLKRISTPSFFINGTLVEGAAPYANFESVINNEIAKANKVIK